MSDLEDEENDDKGNLAKITDRTWARIAEQSFNAGLREGATNECDDSLQKGFSQGFRLAFTEMLNLGELRGKVCAAQALYPDDVNIDMCTSLLERISILESQKKEAFLPSELDTEPVTVDNLPPTLQAGVDKLTADVELLWSEATSKYKTRKKAEDVT